MTGTPYELFDKFTRLTASLPNNAPTWSIHLCSCYLSSYSNEAPIRKITSDITFVMPNLTTKALQLEALRTVMCHASKQFKDLLKKKEEMSIMLRGLNNSTHRGRLLHTGTLSDATDDTTSHRQSYF